MSPIERYVQNVLSLLSASEADHARIEADLRAHLKEGVAAGLSAQEAVLRMGPPHEVAAELMSTLDPAYAPPSRRLGAAVFDLMLVWGVPMLIVAQVFFGWAERASDFGQPGFLMFPLLSLSASAFPLIYFVLTEWLTGQTLGKYLFGLRVASEGGPVVTFGAALVRRVTILFMPAFLLDSAVILVSEKKQRGSEMLAKTLVLRTSQSRPAVVAWSCVVVLLLCLVAVGWSVWQHSPLSVVG